jgi:hypothetical protein
MVINLWMFGNILAYGSTPMHIDLPLHSCSQALSASTVFQENALIRCIRWTHEVRVDTIEAKVATVPTHKQSTKAHTCTQ